MLKKPAIWLCTLLLSSGSLARASRVDDLVSALGGEDDHARTVARQLIVREEAVEAVTKVLPLLSSERQQVWCAAFNVLADLESKVGQAGFEKQRTVVTQKIISLLSANQPEDIKIRALRLLPRVIPDDFDVAPIAALLNEEKLREKALAALEEARTPPAAAAIREQIAKTDPKFQSALLNALGQLKDPASLPAAEAAVLSPDAGVRAAALRAVAWSGDPRYLKLAQIVIDASDEPTRAEALDGELRLVNAMAAKHEGRPAAIEAWLAILKRPDATSRNAALAGLGRVGDGKCVGPMLAAIKDADPLTWRIGIAALRGIRGPEAVRAILAAYPQQTPPAQLALIPVLGSQQDGTALEILRSAAESGNLEFRIAGLKALANAGQPEGGEILLKAAQNGTGEVQGTATRGLVTLAARLREQGRKQDAGKLYAQAFGLAAGDKELCREVAEGVTMCPVAEAYEAAKSGATRQELKDISAKMLLAVGGALTAANQKDKALELYELVRDSKPSMDVMQQLARRMHEAGATIDLHGLLGTIAQWWVVGPFELGEQNAGWKTDYVGETNVSLAGKYMAGKRRITWTPVISKETNGKIDLRKTVADQDQCIGYALAEVVVDQPTDAILLLGVDDSEKVWINGQKVFELFVPRGLTCDEDKIPIKLKAGANTILLKIWQHTLGWEFCARLALPDGRPLSFTQPRP